MTEEIETEKKQYMGRVDRGKENNGQKETVWTEQQQRRQTESVMQLNNWLSRLVQSCPFASLSLSLSFSLPQPPRVYLMLFSYDHREHVTAAVIAHDKVTCAPHRMG